MKKVGAYSSLISSIRAIRCYARLHLYPDGNWEIEQPIFQITFVPPVSADLNLVYRYYVHVAYNLASYYSEPCSCNLYLAMWKALDSMDVLPRIVRAVDLGLKNSTLKIGSKDTSSLICGKRPRKIATQLI